MEARRQPLHADGRDVKYVDGDVAVALDEGQRLMGVPEPLHLGDIRLHQERVDEDEAGGGQQQQPHPPVEQAEGEEQQRAAQAAGHGRVEVPEEGSGVLGDGSQGELRGGDQSLHDSKC
ncbi:hypothetical protein EYF80_017862 [Liparis tanakae]|uniref:Uncharacterized protein n=1 Tax=Liparis tanakae TaxID=230148 RepID=A0A4Z2I302_9TELE|nr:hypothetical protein EYF80_017862 [Liparis tanakae]